MSMREIRLGDNLEILPTLDAESVDLVYIDPPFNTGKKRTYKRVKTRQVEGDEAGDRTGFGGRRYASETLSTHGYSDDIKDFLGFIAPRLAMGHHILKPTGSLFLHMDQHAIHHARLMLDAIFGHHCFQNEIIWAYDYGGRSKKRWPAKHDNILWYSKHPTDYTFNYDAMERIPYMAPGLVGPEKAARGKTPTDVWWHTIVPTAGSERTGYPTQKPLGILNRIISVHSNPGDLVCDYFAGSGTTGESAARLGRDYLLIDSNPEAVQIMYRRLQFSGPTAVGFTPEL
jgi:site-specific DNA-methyltransferase (adenine-specific)